MGRLGTVVRAGLRANFGLATLKYRLVTEKKDRWLVPLVGLAGLGVVPMFYGLVLLIQNVYYVLRPMGQERALLSFGVLAGQLLILLFGVYYVIAAFYFARDLDLLIPLPLRPGEVMASKFAVVVVNEWLTVAAIVLPVVVTLGVVSRAGVGYWVNAALVYAALPVVPLALVSLAVVALMRVVNVSRKKDALILAGSLLLIGLSVALQVGLGRSGGGGLVEGGAEGVRSTAESLAAFFASPNSLLNRVGAVFPPSIWATKAIAGGFSGEGLGNLALFLAVSAGLFAAMVALAERLFYRGVIGLGETTGKRRRLTGDEMSRRVTGGRRAFAAVFGREWRIMNRTPIFLLNGVLVSVLLPALFVLMATVGPGRSEAAGQGGDAMTMLKLLMEKDPLVVVLGAALFMTVCGSINGTASSTFSREGAQFWISQVIPVAPREQAAAKFAHSYAVATLGVITAAVVAGAFLRVGAGRLAEGAVLALVAGVPLTAAGMAIDLARPLLDWTNPQKAIKQNLNVLLALFADAGILTALYFGVKALMGTGLAPNAVLGVVFVGLAVLGAVSYGALMRFADKRYPEI